MTTAEGRYTRCGETWQDTMGDLLMRNNFNEGEEGRVDEGVGWWMRERIVEEGEQDAQSFVQSFLTHSRNTRILVSRISTNTLA